MVKIKVIPTGQVLLLLCFLGLTVWDRFRAEPLFDDWTNAFLAAWFICRMFWSVKEYEIR